MKKKPTLHCQFNPFPVTGADHVYVLPTFEGTRIKIGRSVAPLERIAGLTRVYPEINLSRAVIAEVDSPRIETALHAIFDQRREARPDRSDGYTEWFVGDFVEEALSALDNIAAHRGSKFRLFRNVDGLMADYLARNPNAGQRAPRLTPAERKARAEQAWDLMREAAVKHAQELGDRIAESGFDNVVRCAGYVYLARTVSREQAPECWHPNTGHRASIWGRQFAEAGLADIEVAGGHALFRLIEAPIFGASDETHGREYFRICRDRSETDSGGPIAAITKPAFDELWLALEHLPLVDLPGEWPELPESGNAGLQ